MTARRHYEELLAQHYTWMFGISFEEKVEEQAAVLRAAGVAAPGLAVDLGCGPGFQSIALADMGAAHVHAIDTNAALLSELAGRAAGRPVTTHEADLMQFRELIGEPADTIVCMGDTLTHLAAKSDVGALFANIAAGLRKGGRLVLSWRDLSNPPKGLDRFIPLRSDDNRHMICFLEDQGETVLVHDLIHARGPEGWTFQKGAYEKLKLPPHWIRSQLESAGLAPDWEQSVRGMIRLAARR